MKVEPSVPGQSSSKSLQRDKLELNSLFVQGFLCEPIRWDIQKRKGNFYVTLNLFIILNYSAFFFALDKILYIFVPHFSHVPVIARRLIAPFPFISTSAAFIMFRFSRHFTQ